jgi:hypothetical protein
MRIFLITLPCITTAALLAAPMGYAGSPGAADIEPRATATLQKMVDFFESAGSLSFKSLASTEDVSSTLQKLQFDSSLEGVIQRPNKLYFHKSGSEQMDLWYDGETATMLDRKANKFSKIVLNGDIPALIAKLESLGVEMPFAGLINKSILQHVKDHVFKGDYYGATEIDGVRTIQTAFRQDAIDWQLWTDAETGAPKKVVITSKMLAGAPEHTMFIKEVAINAKDVPASTFQAKVPADATEIPIQADEADAFLNSNW